MLTFSFGAGDSDLTRLDPLIRVGVAMVPGDNKGWGEPDRACAGEPGDAWLAGEAHRTATTTLVGVIGRDDVV